MSRVLTLLVHYAPWLCILYLLFLILVSLLPRYSAPIVKENSSGLLPLEGQNFKVVDAPVVYRLERGHRRPYKSAAAFLLRLENPPFGTPYEEGGILLCDSVVLLFYPLGVKMPDLGKEEVQSSDNYSYQKVNLSCSLLGKDKIGHLLIYIGLAILLWLTFAKLFSLSQNKMLILVVLLGCGIGFLLELGQQFCSKGRDAEWEDMLMNSIGISIGVVFCIWMFQQKTP